MKNFVLIGAAGYIAPRHMKAIKDTGNKLVAALDKNDSVGILDTYFPEADFFTEFERFDRHCEKLKRQGTKIDYVVVCSPNYLHDAHIRFGLRLGADVICEKPLVLNPWNADALTEMEKETGKNVFTILQLRLHPAIIQLKEMIEKASPEIRHTVDLKYITPRGRWYHHSWKGDMDKSGGIVTNIGLHFFDILLWIFGDVQQNTVRYHTSDKASGVLKLAKADVNWFLSIDEADLLSVEKNENNKSYRSLKVDGQSFEFSNGFEELHTKSYEAILAGLGTTISTSKKLIEFLHEIRKSPADNK